MLQESKAAPRNNVVHLHNNRPLALAEARQLIPLIYRITERWHKEAQRLAHQFETAQDQMSRDIAEEQLQQAIMTWSDQIRSVGGAAKGPWLVDFDNGRGFYWCWRYPERELAYFHSHEAGFSGRQPIQGSDVESI